MGPRKVHVTRLINLKPQVVSPFYLVNMSITVSLGFASVNISYAVFFNRFLSWLILFLFNHFLIIFYQD